MSRDGRIALVILAAGIAPALIKKSKPMARYVGDQLIRVGEYLKTGTEETAPEPPPKVSAEPKKKAEPAASAAVAEKPKAAKPKTTAKKPAARKPPPKRAAPKPETPAAEGQA
jgi:hypothetical protein